MDPLSALSVAASVAQFVQFASSLVSKSREIYVHGASLEHVKCESAVNRLVGLTSNIRTSSKELEDLGKLSWDAGALEVICAKCTKLSNELLSQLDKLRVDEKHKLQKWKSFRQALKSVCSKGGVDILAKEIADCREELNSHLIVSIRYLNSLLTKLLDQRIRSTSADL